MNKDNYKWWALALLWVAFFLQQGTRQLFGPSVPAMCASFGVDKVAIGVVGTVFAMMYGICVPFAGLTADLFNRKWMVTIGVGVFCLGIFASGFVASVGLLILTYGILNGLGQTFYYPSATSLISQLHKESRATAISILQLGLYIGIIGCGGLAGFVAGKGGESWRVPFWIFGGIGLAWAVALAIFLRDTKPVGEEGKGNSEKGKSAEGSISGKPTIGEAFKAVFSKPTALCVILGLAMMIYVDIGFKNWMPTYLKENFGEACPFLQHWAGLHAVVWHYLGAIIGVMVGSRIGDKLVKRRPGIRLELGMLGLGLAIPFIVWMALSPSFLMCCVAMFGFGLHGVVLRRGESPLSRLGRRHHAVHRFPVRLALLDGAALDREVVGRQHVLFDVVPGRVLSAGRPRDSAGAHVFSQEGHRTIRSWR